MLKNSKELSRIRREIRDLERLRKTQRNNIYVGTVIEDKKQKYLSILNKIESEKDELYQTKSIER